MLMVWRPRTVFDAELVLARNIPICILRILKNNGCYNIRRRCGESTGGLPEFIWALDYLAVKTVQASIIRGKSGQVNNLNSRQKQTK